VEIKATALIVDDELNNRLNLRNMINRYADCLEVIGEADSVASAVNQTEALNPEIIFLDIELGDGTGFDFLESFEKPTFDVIFVTAYEEFAVRAFESSALDYILKPIDPEYLISAFEKVKNRGSYHSIKERLDILKSNKESLTKIAIATEDSVQLFKISDIVRAESYELSTKIFLKDGSHIDSIKSLKEYDDILGGSGFFRPSKYHLINLDQVNKLVNKSDTDFLYMKDGFKIKVSPRRKHELKRKMIGE